MNTPIQATGPDQQYQAYLSQGRFMIQQDVTNGDYVFFPRAVAPKTGGALKWVKASGRGTVYSTTAVRKRPPTPALSIVLIDLEEGPRMMSRIEGIAAEDVMIGMEVQAKIIPYEEEHIVIFEPIKGRK